MGALNNYIYGDMAVNQVVNGDTVFSITVADGTPEMDIRLKRVLTTDPGTGVARHADAGYEEAIEVARTRGIHTPMLDQ